MNSSDLKKNNLIWYTFSLKNKENILERSTLDIGVYIIRTDKSFGRLKGSSDILYIGKTNAKGGFKTRMKQYFNPGPSQLTNIRIKNFLSNNRVFMEISFLKNNDPESLERDLLKKYVEEHLELPPFNRNSTRFEI